MQRIILVADFFGKQNYVFVFRTENNPVPLKNFEIFGGSKRRGRPMSRNRDVGNIKGRSNPGYSGIFNSEFLIFPGGLEPGSFQCVDALSIPTENHAEMRRECKPHQAIPLAFHHANIDRAQLAVDFPISYDSAGPDIPSRKSCFPWP